jgi:L-methionine (R)-S-oxide reductase
MVSRQDADRILTKLERSGAHGATLRREAMELLDGLDDYDWSGVYRLEGDELVLDEFMGQATDHTRIPVGRGVCGTAVAEGRNQVVQDVRQLENYLSCSAATRSEIVVLIRGEEEILGQIDVDGHKVAAFDSSDEDLLVKVADLLARRW